MNNSNNASPYPILCLQPLTYSLQDCGEWYAKNIEVVPGQEARFQIIPSTLQLKYICRQQIHLITYTHEQMDNMVLLKLNFIKEQGWLYGDILQYLDNKAVNRLIILELSPDHNHFRLFLFNVYFHSKSRKSEIMGIISTIKQARNLWPERNTPKTDPLEDQKRIFCELIDQTFTEILEQLIQDSNDVYRKI